MQTASHDPVAIQRTRAMRTVRLMAAVAVAIYVAFILSGVLHR